jgi:hypothetical protein
MVRLLGATVSFLLFQYLCQALRYRDKVEPSVQRTSSVAHGACPRLKCHAWLVLREGYAPAHTHAGMDIPGPLRGSGKASWKLLSEDAQGNLTSWERPLRSCISPTVHGLHAVVW